MKIKMCDSGISLNSSTSGDERYLSDESDVDQYNDGNSDTLHNKLKVTPQHNPKVTPKLLHKSQVTMSLSSKSSSPSISRASSTLSLASSSYRSSSPVTVMEVRTLTNNFQKMLAQATQEIKKLNIQKTKLEKEQEKLLIVNIELATEAKRMVKENKDGKEEKEVNRLMSFFLQILFI